MLHEEQGRAHKTQRLCRISHPCAACSLSYALAFHTTSWSTRHLLNSKSTPWKEAILLLVKHVNNPVLRYIYLQYSSFRNTKQTIHSRTDFNSHRRVYASLGRSIHLSPRLPCPPAIDAQSLEGCCLSGGRSWTVSDEERAHCCCLRARRRTPCKSIQCDNNNNQSINQCCALLFVESVAMLLN